MKIQVQQSELVRALGAVASVVSNKTTLPILSTILFDAEGDVLTLAATDLDVSLTTSCQAEVDGEGGIAVQARKFLEIIRAVVGDEVRLTLEDEKRLSIVAGMSRFKINGLAPEDFPTLPDVKGEDGIKIPFGQFKGMIGKVIFAVSAEESRFQLNGALLRVKDEALELVATDGHRLALVENPLEGGKEGEGVLVPRKALQELLRFEGQETVEFRRSEHHLSFQLGQRELICRILEGTFPDYERVIAKDNDRQATFDCKNLAEAVQRVALLTGDRARAVSVLIEGEKVMISAANPDLGEAAEEVVCEYGGSEIRLGINPDYMSQFLSAVDTDKVLFELKDENTQAIGFPVEGHDKRYLCVIMPMRI